MKSIKKIKELKENLKKKYRYDSWANPFTGLGTERDKTTYTEFASADRMTDETADILYAEDDIASRVCDTMPEYALRKGFSVQLDPDESDMQSNIEETTTRLKTIESALLTEIKELDVTKKFTDAAVWANVFGACGVLIGGADGALSPEELLQPLDETRIDKITHLNVIDKRYLTPINWYNDSSKAKFGEPETYLITPFAVPSVATTELSNYAGVNTVHESRLLMFGGVRTSTRRRQEFNGWEDSLLQRMQTVLRQFGESFATLTHIISDANQGVFKMDSLIEALAADEDSLIHKRMQLLDTSRSAVRALVLDAGTESFERQNFQWSGIEKPFELLMYRLAAAARQPVSVIMGRAPAGLNATGEEDERNFYDQIEAYRNDKIRRPIERLVRLLMLSKQGPTKGVEPASWQVEFPSMWSTTAMEDAQIYELQTKADKMNIEAGVLLADEVAISRFGPDPTKSNRIAIDLSARMDGGMDVEGEAEE